MYSKFAKLRNRSASWTCSWGFIQPDMNVITEVHVDSFLLVISTAFLNSIVMFCGKKALGDFLHDILPLLQKSSKTCFSSWYIFCDPAWNFVTFFWVCSIFYKLCYIWSLYFLRIFKFLSQPKRACSVYGMFFCLSLVSPVCAVYNLLP